MYLFLENETIIKSKNIILIIDYIHLNSKENKSFFNSELKNKKVINLSPNREKAVIITDDTLYFSSYSMQTLMNRGNEFFNIVGGKK